MSSVFRRLLPILLIPPIWSAAMDPAELPEVLATLNGVPITRRDLAAHLTSRLSPLDARRQLTEVRRVVRRAVDDEICRRLLVKMLADSGISVDRNTALEYIAIALGSTPPAMREALKSELLPHADADDFQLKAAVHLYLLRNSDPEALKVSPGEVERYYRLNLPRYRLPERWDVGVIRIDRRRAGAEDLATSARARLLQGEAFERVALETDPEGGGRSTGLPELRSIFAAELSSLNPGDVSRVVPASDAFYVLLLRGREAGGVIPLAEASAYIQLELSAAKDSLVLRRLLMEKFATQQIEYSKSADQEGTLP